MRRRLIEEDIDLMEELDSIVNEDLAFLSPENNDQDIDCPHIAIGYSSNNSPIGYKDFKCNIATRYYSKGEYIRAYALSPYNNGIAIFANKKSKDITIFILGEDDGYWFISSNYGLKWITHKIHFISLVTEAINIFNTNYKE